MCMCMLCFVMLCSSIHQGSNVLERLQKRVRGGASLRHDDASRPCRKDFAGRQQLAAGGVHKSRHRLVVYCTPIYCCRC
jgi:hypothetical protein